ncbi:MAG: hypothetical protein ACRC17_04900 [Culicoidibacterales bacterium]
MKKVIVLLIAILLVIMNGKMSIQADTIIIPPSIQLIGDAKELAFTQTDEPGFVYTDKFLPGQTLERTLTIRNVKNVPFRLSFKLERTSDVIPEIDLFDQLNITISDSDTNQVLCTGVIENCEQRQLYAILKPGDVRNLTMTVTFNKDAGNEYKNKSGQFDWVFDAIVEGVPTTGNPTIPTIPTTGNPLVNTGLFALELATIGIVLFASGRYLMKRKK